MKTAIIVALFGIVAVVVSIATYFIIKNIRKDYFVLQVQHLSELSKIAQRNDTPIFPRNGFLLGIVRHGGFLPNERIDVDLACFEHDIPKILEGDWSPYKITKVSTPGSDWDKDFCDGTHPVTREPLMYSNILFSHETGLFEEEVFVIYKYKPGYYYYPWWSIKSYNSDNEFRLVSQNYAQGGGGFTILLGYTEVPLSKLYDNPEYLGRVGTVYREQDFSSFYLAPFYNTQIYIPNGSRNISVSNYGSEVFDVMVNKDGKKTKINASNSKPKNL